MSKKAFIHIGSGKTGTSTIQNALFEVEKNGNPFFHYPIIHGNGHQSIEVLFKNYERISRGLRTNFDKDGMYKVFKDEFERSLNDSLKNVNLVLSSEFMFNFTLSEIRCFKDYLEGKGFNGFKVVVYLREPASYYLSLVQQIVKASYKIPAPSSFNARYKNNLKNWIKIFGSDVIVRRFDKDIMVGGSILQDFSSLINDFFKINLSLTGSSSNISVSGEGIVLLQEFRGLFFRDRDNQFHKKSNVLLKKIQNIESSTPGSKPKLKKGYSAIVNSLNRDYFDIVKEFELYEVKDNVYDDVSFDANLTEQNFSGKVRDLLSDFDEDHYNFLMQKIIFELI